MPDASIPGRSFVTRRAIVDLVRSATLGSYGVTGLGVRDVAGRIRAGLGIGGRGIRVHIDGRLELDVRITIAYGLPVAEVARQVDSAVRYTIRTAIGREVDRLTIHVGALRLHPGAASMRPPSHPTGRGAAGTGS